MRARRWNFFGSQRLHEGARRSLCRLAFALGAAAPVLLTLVACVAEFVPSYQRSRAVAYQRQLSAAIGCAAEISAVELRAPNHYILHGVKLFHPETSELLVRVDSLDVFEGTAGYALRLIRPEISAENLSDTYRLLHEQILCRPASQDQATVAWLDGLSIHSGLGGRTQFRNVRLELQRRVDSTQATLAFGLDGVAGQAANCQFSRQHNSDQPTSHLKLASGGQRLPGHWVSYFAPQLAIPGDTATFTGQFELDYVLSDWTLKGRGQLRDVDTTTWTQRPMLSGLAQIDVSDFSISDQGLERIGGNLIIKDGRVQSALLQSAIDIGIRPAAPLAQTNSSAHPFTQIALDFALDSHGLVLNAGLANGAVAIDGLGALAEQYYVGIVPMRNVVTALAKTSALDGTQQDLVDSPTVRRLVHWLPQPVTTIATEQTSYQVNAIER